jgi:hypothetical protein
MPLALLFIGLLLVIVAIKGNYSAVFSQLETDLTGSGNFLVWIFAIMFVAIAGKILELPQAAKLFVTLILVVYVVSNVGIFTKAEQAFADFSAAPAPASTSPAPASTSVAPYQPFPSTLSPGTPSNPSLGDLQGN